MSVQSVDVFVIGSGPAGQKAAVQAAKGGRSVCLCEQLREIGGACVQFGTIPSKALRERALTRVRARATLDSEPGAAVTNISIAELIGETDELVRQHDFYMRAQLERNDIDIVNGRCAFVTPTRLRVRFVGGGEQDYECGSIVIATGSAPRLPDNVAVDHEHIYDSDSILSIGYLPETLLVFGGGVIACEYASVFALLGVRVLQLDRSPRPLGFLDPVLTTHFLQHFESMGGRFVGAATLRSAVYEPGIGVVAELDDGTRFTAEKALCALGRVAQVQDLDLPRAGLVTNERQLIPVTVEGQTKVPHIYAAGDVVGPPSLASTSMQQGRRAARALLGLDPGSDWDFTPIGVYAVPEIGSVGLSEEQARAQFPAVLIGVAHYGEIARGLIDSSNDGFLKLVADGSGRLLGAHAVGGPAAELVHIAQMALLFEAQVEVFVANVFNFPTFAETYRVAALAILAQLD